MRLLAAWLGLLVSAPAFGQQIDVVLNEDLARQAGLDPEQVRQDIRGATEGALKLDTPQAFLDQMAAANAFATKGMGVDYASNPQRFFAGGALGTAVNGQGLTFVRGKDTLPTGGFAFQAAVNAGLNLGILAKDESFWRRVVVSANGIWASGASGPFDAELYNVGAHLQVKLVRPPHEGLVEWGGLDVGSGYEISSYRLLLRETLPIEGGGVRWDANGSMDVRAESHTIPVEVSTNLRVFVFSVYAGGALDIRRSATADGALALGGPVIAEAQGRTMEIGTVDASMALQGTTAEYVPRVFGGVQINVLYVKVYGHLNVGFDDSYAGHLGARFAL